MINDEDYEKSRVISAKKFETNDIFNKKLANNLVEKKNSIRVRNNLEPSLKVKKLVDQKTKRPENIKNVFESQINLSYK